MTPAHFAHWPPGLPRHLTVPETNLFFNVEVAAARYPDKPFIVFYDRAITFAEFKHQTELIAGFLQHDCGVRSGDRVLLYLQNSPQWVLAYYGILRANAVVGVPSAQWGESPVAFVVRREGQTASVDTLRNWLNSEVGKTQRLADLVCVEELPRNAIGKVLKRELRERYVAQS